MRTITKKDDKDSKNKKLCKSSLKAFANQRRSPASGYEPRYNPKVWNVRRLRKSTNCYSYALDLPWGIWYGRLNPGDISDQGEFDYTVKQLVERIESDFKHLGIDFMPIGFSEKCPEGMYKIALTIKPDRFDKDKIEDYHFYRQNRKKGLWSHKPGHAKATLLDKIGRHIMNPRRAKRGKYTEFIGYYAIGRNVRKKFAEEFVRYGECILA